MVPLDFKGNYAYVLTTSVYDHKNILTLHLAQQSAGQWRRTSAEVMEIRDRPWKLFRNPKNLQASMSRSGGKRGGTDYQFDWCLFGYTTDPKVIAFRLKTSTGYIPLETIHRHYFMRLLSDAEQQSFVEVQGLAADGEIVQRWNGIDPDKPRNWSPQHSAMY